MGCLKKKTRAFNGSRFFLVKTRAPERGDNRQTRKIVGENQTYFFGKIEKYLADVSASASPL